MRSTDLSSWNLLYSQEFFARFEKLFIDIFDIRDVGIVLFPLFIVLIRCQSILLWNFHFFFRTQMIKTSQLGKSKNLPIHFNLIIETVVENRRTEKITLKIQQAYYLPLTIIALR